MSIRADERPSDFGSGDSVASPNSFARNASVAGSRSLQTMFGFANTPVNVLASLGATVATQRMGTTHSARSGSSTTP